MKLTATKTGVPGRKVVRGKGFSIEVTTKQPDVEIPARGLIETQDIKLLVFTNSAKQIIKFELTCGKTKHTFSKDHPFIMWSDVESTIEAYLQSQLPKESTTTTISLPRRKAKL